MTSPEAPELPHVGDTVGRKYTLVGLLGDGAMGVVYEAVHVRLRQRLAVKVLRPDFQGYAEVFHRFEREARVTAQLRSIHTARVIDVDTLESGLPYIVMEYLEGRDLEAELTALGTLPVEEAVDVVLQVAAAMAEAHENRIVHRDIKPANLFVCRSGGRRVMKVLDFGISRSDDDSARITLANGCVGTPCYAAPEQLRDAKTADARSDVWSLGTVMYELLAGRTPFQGGVTSVIAQVMSEPPPWLGNLRPDLPKELVRVVMTALQRDPRARYQSMHELAAALVPFGLPRSTTDALVEAQRGRSRLGEILVAEGLLPQAGLQRALAEQRRTGHLLGRTLLDLGLVSRADLLVALAKQQGVGDLPGEGVGLDDTVPAPPWSSPRSSREAMTFTGRADRGAASGRLRRSLVAAGVGLTLGVVGVAAAATATRSGSASVPAAMVATGAQAQRWAVESSPAAVLVQLAPRAETTDDTATTASPVTTTAPATATPPATAAAAATAQRGRPAKPLVAPARSAPFDPSGI